MHTPCIRINGRITRAIAAEAKTRLGLGEFHRHEFYGWAKGEEKPCAFCAVAAVDAVRYDLPCTEGEAQLTRDDEFFANRLGLTPDYVSEFITAFDEGLRVAEDGRLSLKEDRAVGTQAYRDGIAVRLDDEPSVSEEAKAAILKEMDDIVEAVQSVNKQIAASREPETLAV